MTFIWGLKRDNNRWVDGQLLDINNGKVYRCYLHLLADGRRMQVRVYLGTPFFGRSLMWRRMETPYRAS